MASSIENMDKDSSSCNSSLTGSSKDELRCLFSTDSDSNETFQATIQTNKIGFDKIDEKEIDTNTIQTEKQDRKPDVNCFLDSLYQDLDNIILDANQNPTIPNFNLNHGLLLYKIKSLNEKLKDQNQQIQVVHVSYYFILYYIIYLLSQSDFGSKYEFIYHIRYPCRILNKRCQLKEKF